MLSRVARAHDPPAPVEPCRGSTKTESSIQRRRNGRPGHRSVRNSNEREIHALHNPHGPAGGGALGRSTIPPV